MPETPQEMAARAAYPVRPTVHDPHLYEAFSTWGLTATTEGN